MNPKPFSSTVNPDPGFSSSPPHRPRLLLVEDDPALGNFLAMMLQTEYRVHLVCDGLQARDLARRDVPDLILSDVKMPGLDGVELTRCLREHPATAAIPIILLSGCNRPQTRARCLEAGANEFLLKPFRAQELFSHLRRYGRP